MGTLFDFSMPHRKRLYRAKYNGVLVGDCGFPLEREYASDMAVLLDELAEKMSTSRRCFEIVTVEVR